MKKSALLVLLFMTVIFIGCSDIYKPYKNQAINKHKNPPDHIVIVIEENKGFDQIIGNLYAPYINKLAHQGIEFIDAGVWHPSQPNYLALFSGSRQGVKNDHCLKKETPFKTPNLGHELLENGYSIAGYFESMPKIGYTDCSYGKSTYPNGSPLYARKHNPIVDWQGKRPQRFTR
jgi:acid phosphatase